MVIPTVKSQAINSSIQTPALMFARQRKVIETGNAISRKRGFDKTVINYAKTFVVAGNTNDALYACEANVFVSSCGAVK